MGKNIIAEKIDTINYSGQVTVSIARGNKIVSSYKYHNEGRNPLFKFLCNALAGNYSEGQRPLQIKLFYYTKADTVTAGEAPELPSDFDWEDSRLWERNIIKEVSSFEAYNTAPVLVKSKATGNYQVTYHFRVPFTKISGRRIHIVGLYPTNVSSLQEDASAYYLFAEKNEWKPIDVEEDVGNFSIVIDWTLSLQNTIAINQNSNN